MENWPAMETLVAMEVVEGVPGPFMSAHLRIKAQTLVDKIHHHRLKCSPRYYFLKITIYDQELSRSARVKVEEDAAKYFDHSSFFGRTTDMKPYPTPGAIGVGESIPQFYSTVI